MKNQDTSTTVVRNPQESALPVWFHEGSAPGGMSAIRVNVEEASDGGREDLIRDVSPLRRSFARLDDKRRAVTRFCLAGDPCTDEMPRGGGLSVVIGRHRGNRACLLLFVALTPLPSPRPRRLSISSFLPPFR